MTTPTDRSTATAAEFDAVLARVEAAEADPNSAVEKVARAMVAVGGIEDTWDFCREEVRVAYRALAQAAVDALKAPAPETDEALRRVLADLTEAVGRGDEHGLPEAYRAAVAALRGPAGEGGDR